MGHGFAARLHPAPVARGTATEGIVMAETDYGGSQEPIRQTNALDDLSDELDRQLAETIGLIVMEWSRIHDRLSRIFARVIQVNYEVAFAIWNTILSDKAQREILRNATIEAYRDEQFLEIKDDIIQLVKDLDNVGEKRNSLVHCSFSFLVKGNGLVLIPSELSTNKHARRLRGKEIRPYAQEQYQELKTLGKRSVQIFMRLP